MTLDLLQTLPLNKGVIKCESRTPRFWHLLPDLRVVSSGTPALGDIPGPRILGVWGHLLLFSSKLLDNASIEFEPMFDGRSLCLVVFYEDVLHQVFVRLFGVIIWYALFFSFNREFVFNLLYDALISVLLFLQGVLELDKESYKVRGGGGRPMVVYVPRKPSNIRILGCSRKQHRALDEWVYFFHLWHYRILNELVWINYILLSYPFLSLSKKDLVRELLLGLSGLMELILWLSGSHEVLGFSQSAV